MELETEFFSAMMELNYSGNEKKEIDKKIKKIKQLSSKISWAKGWPENKKAFWNAEAFMWSRKIEKQKREFIANELTILLKVEKAEKLKNKNPTNLDLGCGSYSYIPSTVGVDFSEKMLQFNNNCEQKVVADLEEKLPFSDNNFATITAIFLLNYIHNYELLLSEIARILIDEGSFVMVLGAKGINKWEKQQEVNHFRAQQWINVLQKCNFEVNFKEKEGLYFFFCKIKK